MNFLAAIVAAFSLTFVAQSSSAQEGGGRAPGTLAAQTPQSSETIRVRGVSHSAVEGPSEHFTGSAQIESLFGDNLATHTSAGRVTFKPGARTAWHSHPMGQTLIVTAGTGWIEQWGGPVQEIREGDVIWIPPNVKHWHGATPSTTMIHIAIQDSLDGKAVEWMEKVSDQQYENSQSKSTGVTGVSKEPSAAQKLIGDFDPKLAELTDNVLFGDVWERPGLSKRDRSLITVAALIALNRPEQLRAHLQRAKENGVTKEEVTEVITHLAFYAGWPNAINAVPIARETFK